jgi:DNA-binding PadR family transcriptional regulator
MIETHLGNFEEVILLMTGILGDDAYAFRISEEIEIQTGKASSIGAVHSTLTRLENKGFLTSQFESRQLNVGEEEEYTPLQLLENAYDRFT